MFSDCAKLGLPIIPLPRIHLLTAVALILCVSTSPGAIVRVSPEGDNSNGETWETAYSTVSTAVSSASSGDELWIREGTYFESIDITKPLSLFGGFAGTEADGEFDLRDWKARVSVLDASGTTESVIDIVGVEGVVLDGLHIQNAEPRFGGGVETPVWPRFDSAKLRITSGLLVAAYSVKIVL